MITNVLEGHKLLTIKDAIFVQQNASHQSGRGPMKKEDATVKVISTEQVSIVSTAAENKENSITTQQLGQENPKASSTESSTSMLNSD